MKTRNDFMNFFRDDDLLNTLSNDDRKEVFKGILSGSSDITVSFLYDLLNDYGITNINVYENEE